MADGTVSRREQAYRQGRAADAAREQRRMEPFVDPFLLPAGANPERDRQVAVSELGTPVYETLLGARYTLEQATMYPQPRGEARELSLENLLAFAKELGLGAVQGVVQGVTAPGRALAGEPVTLGDVWATAGLAGSGAIPRAASLPDPDVASMFGGKGTTNPTAQRSLARAEELRDQGKDFDDIWRITSEEFPEAPASILPDGTPFYEFSDVEALTRSMSKVRAQDLADEAGQPGIGLEERTMLIAEANRLLDEAPLAITDTYRPLQEVLTHPRLYADYPELATAVKVREDPSLLKGTTLGEYYPDRGDIKLRPGRPTEDVLETLLHETQHGIAGRPTKDVPQGANQTVLSRLFDRATGTDEVYDVRSAKAGVGNLVDLSPDPALNRELTKTLRNTLEKDYKTMYDAASANRLLKDQPVQPGEGVYTGPYGMYRRDPGEALARLTSYRREYGMGQRREISPATDLARREGISWSRLAKLQTAADIRKMFPAMQTPSAKGVDAKAYAEAVNLFTNNALPTLIDDAKLVLRSVSDADRPKAIALAQRNINEAFKKWLSKYEIPPTATPAAPGQPTPSMSSAGSRLPPPEASQRTQIAGTFPTYQKAVQVFDTVAPRGRSLDYGAGLGLSSRLGFDTFEPYARQGFDPTYRSSAQIPSDAYERVTNLNVLNVLDPDARSKVVQDIGRVLKPGGVAVITTRGRDVLTSRGVEGPEPMSVVTSAGTYQKGFTRPELLSYLRSTLGEGFEVRPLDLGPAGALVRKLPTP